MEPGILMRGDEEETHNFAVERTRFARRSPRRLGSSSRIPSTIRAEIRRRLAKVEEDEGVRIFTAVESGSRAWGFPSPDSDFDVRFIYCRPQRWYFSVDLEEKRDVLEYEITDNIDLNGWDLRKTLRLLARSNPTVVECCPRSIRRRVAFIIIEAWRKRTIADT